MHQKTFEQWQIAMDDWYRTSLGKAVYKAETDIVSTVLASQFGYHLLQIGSCQTSWLSKSPIRHKVHASPEFLSTFYGPSIQFHEQSLPFKSNSVDVIVLPHVLEGVKDPNTFLEQATTALIPQGVLVLLAFNKYSVWQMMQCCGAKSICPPWGSGGLGCRQVKKQLKALGMEICSHQGAFFLPPFQSQQVRNSCRILEWIGKKCWPYFGGVFIVVARKKVATMTPLRCGKRQSGWRSSTGSIEPTARRQ